jgi:hypothetical protein
MSRYLAPVMFLLLSALLYVSYIDPTYAEIKNAQNRDNELVGYIEDAKQAQVKIDDLKAQYAAFPPGADQALSVLIPDTIDPIRLIVDMDAVIGKLGLVMKSPSVSVDSGDESSLLTLDRVNKTNRTKFYLTKYNHFIF